MNGLCCLAIVMFHHDIMRGIRHKQIVSLVVSGRLALIHHLAHLINLSRQPKERSLSPQQSDGGNRPRHHHPDSVILYFQRLQITLASVTQKGLCYHEKMDSRYPTGVPMTRLGKDQHSFSIIRDAQTAAQLLVGR